VRVSAGAPPSGVVTFLFTDVEGSTQTVIGSGRHDEVPFGFEGVLGTAYAASGKPERWVEWCRARLGHLRDTHAFTRACLVVALMFAGCGKEARAATNGLIEAAEATRHPWALSSALWVHGWAFQNADPAGALEALRRGLVIARDSGIRYTETLLADTLSRLEAEHGEPLAALDHVTLAIRNWHDAGNTTMIRIPLAVIAAVFDRLGRHEAAATIAGFAVNRAVARGFPEINTAITHLRDLLGDQTYESLAHKGETMTTAEMVTYAYDQIDQARAELKAASK
jgi:hypothetical protein